MIPDNDSPRAERAQYWANKRRFADKNPRRPFYFKWTKEYGRRPERIVVFARCLSHALTHLFEEDYGDGGVVVCDRDWKVTNIRKDAIMKAKATNKATLPTS